ncbi:MAG: hypothetical protein Q7T05_00750 [Dehalococcoidia bacterium]|nr:hypothetical protein [Dehalococcoidia bacterium]
MEQPNCEEVHTTDWRHDEARFPLYTLHTSLAIRWWLTHLAHANEAKRFVDDKLATGRVGVVAVEGTDLQILNELSSDLGQFRLSPTIAVDLFNDVSKVFEQMAERGILRTVNSKPLAFPAFVIACLYNISLWDALAVALAAQTGCPLLVADEELHQVLRVIQADRPAFQVAWLPDI